MDQNKERIQILDDVRQGALDIPEAINRLQALVARSEASANRQTASGSNRELRIMRIDLTEDKALMDIRLPLALLDAANRLGARIQLLLDRIPPGQLENALASPGKHKLFAEINTEQNEQLEIYLI